MSINYEYIVKKDFEEYLKSLDYIDEENIVNQLEFYEKNNDKIINSKAKSILIKGDVQSGKTNNIIYLISELQKENDYFIYLSGHLNDLNNQNMERIKNASTYIIPNYSVINMNRDIISRQFIEKKLHYSDHKKLLFFGIKNKQYLKNVVDAIKRYDENSKIVIIDDESDSHTISSSHLALRKEIMRFQNVKYISVTATPYLNLYHHKDLYEDYFVYKSPKFYTGLESFLISKKYKIYKDDVKALINLTLNAFKRGGGTIIWNVDRTKKEHKNQHSMVKGFLPKIASIEVVIKFLKNNNLSIEEFKTFISDLSRKISISNSDYKDHYKGNKIIIGRENMSRGITYEKLNSELIIMDTKKFNPAVIMQASRWFGYRNLKNMLIIMNEKLFNAYEECLELEKMTNTFNISENFKEKYDSFNFEYLINLDKIK